MGKSSLITKATYRLKDRNIKFVKISLEEIGTNRSSITERIWYLSLLEIIKRELGLSSQYAYVSQNLSFPMFFIGFFRDVVLKETSQQVVIIIDEIDSMLNLDFRADFFAAIRHIYNLRADDLEFNRITFVLVGVALPTDLINDNSRTPFNIGHAISLGEMPMDKVLIDGVDSVFPGKGRQILERVFYWTSGHPYLTQSICKEIVSERNIRKGLTWTREEIDVLVKELFFSEKIHKDQNLYSLKRLILEYDKASQGEVLKCYREILNGKKIKVDNQSDAHERLLLSGLVKVVDRCLHVKNRIYERGLGEQWVKENLLIKIDDQ